MAEHAARGDADIGIATEALASFPDLVTLPCYQWNRCVLVPRGHPLAKVKVLTLAALARHPIITYDFAFTGRSQINAAFDAEGLAPNVVLTALDSDVIKTYVELGMGVGIVAQMAHDPDRDRAFVKLDAGHLFAPSTTRLAVRRGAFLRGYVYEFIRLFAPALDRGDGRCGAGRHTLPGRLTRGPRPERRDSMIRYRNWLVVALTAGVIAQGAAAADTLPTVPLSINGHKITAEVAATPEQRATGSCIVSASSPITA